MFSSPTLITSKEIVSNGVNAIAQKAESLLNADLCWYCGGINDVFMRKLPSAMEALCANSQKHKTLAFVLTTHGGLAEVAERAVEVMRHFYERVVFIVPDMAMSAGTILCLSGDDIYMRYTSCLGPIDAQVWTGDRYISASAYLEKVEALIEKSRSEKDGITEAELRLLLQQDLGRIASFEQAANLAKDLACNWLVKYKFRHWTNHESNPAHPIVTEEQKQSRAAEIVDLLGNNVYWHSHARRISMDTLRRDLRLKILDLSETPELDAQVCCYHSALRDYIMSQNATDYFHNRFFF